MFRMAFVSLIAMSLVWISTGYAADSPQFRGINRDGIFPEKGLMKEWNIPSEFAIFIANELVVTGHENDFEVGF